MPEGLLKLTMQVRLATRKQGSTFAVFSPYCGDTLDTQGYAPQTRRIRPARVLSLGQSSPSDAGP